MTWQVISERSSQTPGIWPHPDLIDSFREKVEAGTHWMAHRPTKDGWQLVIKPRRNAGRKWEYWTAPKMPDLKSERMSEGNEMGWRRGKRNGGQ